MLIAEFGNALPKTEWIEGKFPRVRFGDAWARHLPGTLQALLLIFVTTLRLLWLSLKTGKPALLVSHGIFEAAIVYTLSTILRVPYFCHIHEAYDRSEMRRFNIYWWLLCFEGRILRNAEHLIFPEAGRARLVAARGLAGGGDQGVSISVRRGSAQCFVAAAVKAASRIRRKCRWFTIARADDPIKEGSTCESATAFLKTAFS